MIEQNKAKAIIIKRLEKKNEWKKNQDFISTQPNE